jgi:hypothetical protein
MKRQTKKAIAGLSVGALAKFRDSEGNRLHPKAIGGEIARRVKVHQQKHPKIVRHRAKQRSRSLK